MSFNIKTKYFRSAVAGVASLMLWSIGAASADPVIDEILVTARKRVENMQDVPTSVSVLTGEDLLERGMPTIDAIGKIVPNVHFEAANATSGMRAPQVFMRGMGQSDFIIVEDPAVGIYLDGVFAGRMIGNNFDLIDIERVEVLRGPQGTLFGRNTVGGAVNIISKRPEMEYGHSMRVAVGEDGHQELRASVNLPFSDTSAARGTVFTRERDGYIKGLQYDDYDFGDENVWGARVQFTSKASDRLTIDFSADYSEDSSHPSGASLVSGVGFWNGAAEEGPGNPGQFGNFWNAIYSGDAASCTSANGQATNEACYGSVWNTNDRYASNAVLVDQQGNVIQPDQDGTVWGGNLTLTYDLDNMEIKSITSYREFDYFTYNDIDFSPHVVFHNMHPEYSQEQLSQEIQITGNLLGDRLHYVLGAYYFAEEGTEYIYNQIPFPAAAGGAGAPTYFFQDIYRDVDNDSKAIFAQLTYDVSDRLHVTLGDRYTKSKKSFELLTQRSTGDSFQFGELEESEHTPMASVSYDLNDDAMVYVTYSEGFRDGGYPARFVGVVPNPLPNYDPEFLTNYEIGFKSTLANGRVRLNASYFMMDYEDMQITATSTIGAQTSKANLGEASIDGLELEILAVPIDRLTLGLNIGLLDDEIDSLRGSLVSAGIPIELDHDLPFTPDWTMSLTVGYEIPLASGASINLRADYSEKDDYYTSIENLPNSLEGDYRMVNANISYTSPDDRWSFGLIGNNITDEDFYQSRTGFSSLDLTFGQPVRPRTFSAYFAYRM